MNKNNHEYSKLLDEFMAKNLVAFNFDESLKKLSKDECPDFSSDVCGVEIVKSTTKHDSIFEKFNNKYDSKKLSEISDKDLHDLDFDRNNAIEKENLLTIRNDKGDCLFFAKKDNDYIFTFSFKHEKLDDEQSIINIQQINKKSAKLNTLYSKRKRNILIVLIKQQINFILDTNDEFINYIGQENKNLILKELNNNISNYFDELYITYYDVVFKYDCNNYSFAFKRVDSGLFKDICNYSLEEINKV